MSDLDAHGEAIEGEDALQRWLQDLMDETVAALDGTHFDLAPPLRTVEAMIAPPGTAAAQYYTAPTADFSRPGRTWYPTMGRSRFPIWNEISTCYHEGVPGHHLQLAQWVYVTPELSRFQSGTMISGNIEGWALYAERLMDELGFLSDPGARLGYLVAQQLRAARVIVDIGMHLSLAIPGGQPFHSGERWTAELGREFLGLHAGKDVAFLDSEWVRYLGWPGQAISYKLGERVWLAGRSEAQRRAAAGRHHVRSPGLAHGGALHGLDRPRRSRGRAAVAPEHEAVTRRSSERDLLPFTRRGRWDTVRPKGGSVTTDRRNGRYS